MLLFSKSITFNNLKISLKYVSTLLLIFQEDIAKIVMFIKYKSFIADQTCIFIVYFNSNKGS